jgi:cystathionine beta-lyase/cystathionine gamma-synthase
VPARGVLSVIDNTFASPMNQQPLALGVDLAMQSATKYLNAIATSPVAW